MTPAHLVTPSQPLAPTGGMTVTGIEQASAKAERRLPPPERVRSDVWAIPVPIPDSSLGYTISYLLQGDSENVLVDPGWDSDSGWAVLQSRILCSGTALEGITGVVMTHAHHDHLGLARRVTGVSGAWTAMHELEAAPGPTHAWGSAAPLERDEKWLVQAGVPVDVRATLTVDSEIYSRFTDPPAPDRLLEDGELLPLAGRSIRAVLTPGHTAGHLCLHDEDNDLLLTGDHILPRISPNIGLHENTLVPPLGPYLASLDKCRQFGNAEVLPGHEWRFMGLATRIDQMLAHHLARCTEILEFLSGSAMSAWELTTRLTWSRGWAGVTGLARRSALAETLAHLAYLVDRAQLDIWRTGGTRLYRTRHEGSQR